MGTSATESKKSEATICTEPTLGVRLDGSVSLAQNT